MNIQPEPINLVLWERAYVFHKFLNWKLAKKDGEWPQIVWKELPFRKFDQKNFCLVIIEKEKERLVS